jgi:WH1 domain
MFFFPPPTPPLLRSISPNLLLTPLFSHSQGEWQPQGGGDLCQIALYRHSGTGKHRIIGLTRDRSCLVNVAVGSDFVWNRASAAFGQFKDPERMYGLNFKSLGHQEIIAKWVFSPACDERLCDFVCAD